MVLWLPRTVVRRLSLAWILVLALVLASSFTMAKVAGPPMTFDELDLARWVAQVGDRAAMTYLSAEHTSAERCLAVQASSSLRDPERALPILAVIAGGRDPDLAPRAAEVAVRIAQRLSVDDLSRREVLFSDLRAPISAFSKLQEQKDLRPDMALQVDQVLVQLNAFAVLNSEPKPEQ